MTSPSPTTHHEDQETETSQEKHELLQIQLQLQAAFPDPHRRDFLSGGAEKQDSDQRADAQIPDGGGAAVHHKLCTERAGDSGERVVRSQTHPAEVSGQEVSAFQEPSPGLRVSAVHAGRHKPTPLLCSYTGLHGDHRPEEDPRGSSALHHPQHHRAGQTEPGIARPRPGRSAGRAGEPGPAAEHPQPEGGAGNQPEGRREEREEEEEETEQPQPYELPQEEEERSADATAEEAGGAGGEGEEKSTQEKKDGLGSCWYKHTMMQEDRDSAMLFLPLTVI